MVAAAGLLLMLADGPPLAAAYLLGCVIVIAALGEWVLVRRSVGPHIGAPRAARRATAGERVGGAQGEAVGRCDRRLRGVPPPSVVVAPRLGRDPAAGGGRTPRQPP